jgi:DNA-binding NtrC family response regulator
MVDGKRRHAAVMIVDDEPDTAGSLKETLETLLEVQVITAANPKEALEQLRENPVHLILSDYNMPGMTGYQFLHAAQKIYPGVHLMLMTGFATMAEKDENVPWLEGAFHKPIDPKRLVHAIRERILTFDDA